MGSIVLKQTKEAAASLCGSMEDIDVLTGMLMAASPSQPSRKRKERQTSYVSTDKLFAWGNRKNGHAA